VHYYASYLVQPTLPADYERLLELCEEVLDLNLRTHHLEEELSALSVDPSGSEADSASTPESESDLD